MCIRDSYHIPEKRHVNLLYVTRGYRFGRYFTINDLSRLLGDQIAPKRGGCIDICRACLRHFPGYTNLLREHWKTCVPNSSVQLVPVIELSSYAVGRYQHFKQRRRSHTRSSKCKRHKKEDEEKLGENEDMCLSKCTLCCTATRDSYYTPCMHLVSCFKCASRAKLNNPFCVICRTRIESINKVYLV